jgi:phosphate transport system permease protein
MSVELEERKTVQTRAAIQREESRLRLRARKFLDRCAGWVITSGGFAVIASIVAILVFITLEIAPLFKPANVTLVKSLSAGELVNDFDPQRTRVMVMALEENQEIGYLILDNGIVQFYSPVEGLPRERVVLQNLQGEKITAICQSLAGTQLICGTETGKAFMITIYFNPRFIEGGRRYEPAVTESATLQIDPAQKALMKVSFAGEFDENIGIAAITEDARVVVYLQNKETSLFGDAEVTSVQHELPKKWATEPTAVTLDGLIRNLYVGTSGGKIYHWTLALDQPPQFIAVNKIDDESIGVAALDFLIGGRTLLVGETNGNVSAWFLVRDSTSVAGWRLTRIHNLQPHPAAVSALATSARGKGFISGDQSGNLLLHYTTSERMLAQFSSGSHAEIRFINFAPKANGAVTLDAENNLAHWRIDNPHPEASVKAFFGKIWYEGYEKPDYVWQSTGGTDDFESKFSLMPLIFGSLKGTFYALIFAIPIAILAAIYTSQFMHPSLRNYIKPTVEIMAALPSVVLGFLAGLWLAPLIENRVPAVLLMLIVLPPLIILCAFVWQKVPNRIRARLHPGVEGLLLIPIIVIGGWLCMQFNTTFERVIFGGDFKAWIYNTLNLSFDQRNALVVGFVMGFAVIPIIFTISEDALSNVPRALVSGSLALGATPWQTAMRVVLPTAAAGIFSAIMIGFGRAVGETMIVLMATGNTPIREWNIFNGFRTLSANIAVEIPEAPVGGTLYRVLFLAAFLLFIITFLVNTLAELVRQKLREKYQKL